MHTDDDEARWGAEQLNAYLNAQDAAQVSEERFREEFGDDYAETYAVAGRAARFLPPSVVKDAADPMYVMRYTDTRGWALVVLPGVDGETECADPH